MNAVPTPVRRRFRAIWLAPLLALLSLVAWAYASPVGASPDDDFHLVSIWCANSAQTDLCRPVADPTHREVPEVLLKTQCYAFAPTQSAACQAPLWNEADVWVETDRGNFTAAYPPVYYATMSIFANQDIQTAVLTIRFVNALLFVGLSSVLWWLLPVRMRRVVPAMWLITLIPLGLFVVASINPSSWAVTGVGVSWLAMFGFLDLRRGWRKWALGALALVAFVMATGARSDAALISVIGFGIAGVLAARRERGYLLSLLLPVALTVIAFVSFLSTTQSAVAISGLPSGPVEEVPSVLALLFFNILGAPTLWLGVFGYWGLGWLDTVMSPVVWVATFFVFAGIIFMSLRTVPKRIGWLSIGLIAVLWALPTYILTTGGNMVGQNVQPRYLLPLLVLLAGLSLLPWRRDPLRPSPVQAVVIAVMLGGAAFTALFLNIRRYTVGEDGADGFDLDSSAEWWWSGLPIGPTGMWIVGGLAFAALVSVVVHDWMHRVERLDLTARVPE